MKFISVVSYDSEKGIGINYSDGKYVIPWRFKEDMEHFRKLTSGGIVIMGRKTYESIGKPLPDRLNFIISRTKDIPGCQTFADPMSCIRQCKFYDDKKIFVIGGGEIYKWFIDNNFITEEYVTEIDVNYQCNVFYPSVKYSERKLVLSVVSQNIDGEKKQKVNANFNIYHQYVANHNEQKMLDIMRELITSNYVIRNDRTNVGTISTFGKQIEFDLSKDIFPLMTTRRMFFRGIFEELMMFIRGETDSTIMERKGINIWKDNTSREFLNSRGLFNLPVGDMGHSYGFSMRHFGGNYIDCKTDYKNEGFDQLTYVINEIKNNPCSRRLIINLWEPNFMHKAALPPCLYMYQFYVSNGELSCMMTQRSSDFALAGGWNVATGSLLTILLASVCNLAPKKLIWCVGDLHIYSNNVDSCSIQIERCPTIYPKLIIVNKKTDITKYEYSDLSLINYNPQSSITFSMNA